MILLWATLFTPLIISPETIFPFQTGKGILYRVLVELSAFSSLCLCVIEPKFRPKPNPLFWSVLIFAGTLLLTLAASPNLSLSFWGDLERMEGVFGILHGVVLFLVAYGLFTRREDWTRFFAVSLVVSVFVSLYAFAQVNPSLRFFSVFEPKDVQPGSTLGHQSFVAAYAIFQIFFGLFVAVMQQHLSWRIFGLSASALNLILFMLAGTRGAQLGMFAALGFGILLASLYVVRDRTPRFVLAGVLVAGIVFVSTILALRDTSFMKSLPYGFQRMSSISTEASTARTRLISLQVSWEAFKEKPLLGWGQEHFKVAYNRHFDPLHLSYEQSWFDRAHNKVAEVAVQSGIVGLLGYLAMFGAAFVGVIRFLGARESRSEQMLSVGVIMLGTAYCVQNLFLFDTTTSYLLFFPSLAFAGFLARRTADGTPSPQEFRTPAKLPRLVSVVVLIAAGMLTLLLLVYANWIPYRTARLGRTAVDLNQPRHVRTILTEIAESGGFSKTEVIAAVTDALINSGAAKQKDWGDVVGWIEQQHTELPLSASVDARMLIRLGKLYNDRAFADRSFLPKAERVLRKAIALSPTRPEGYQELGVTCLLRGDGEQGLRLFREALALNENNSRARWVLGLALASQNRLEEGLGELEGAMAAGYNWDTPADIGNLAAVYGALNMTDKLVELYQLVVGRHPEHTGYRNALAEVHRRAGE